MKSILFFILLSITNISTLSQPSDKEETIIQCFYEDDKAYLSIKNIYLEKNSEFIIQGLNQQGAWVKKVKIDKTTNNEFLFTDSNPSSKYRIVQFEKNGFNQVVAKTSNPINQEQIKINLFTSLSQKKPLELIFGDLNINHPISCNVYNVAGETIYFKSFQLVKNESLITAIDLSNMLIDEKYFIEIKNGEVSLINSIIVN